MLVYEKLKKQADKIITVKISKDIPLQRLGVIVATAHLERYGYYTYTQCNKNVLLILGS